MKVLLVRPPITLTVARRLQAFLHLEPLALDIVHDMGMGWYCDVFHPHGGSMASSAERKLLFLPAWLRGLKRMANRLLPPWPNRMRPESSSWWVGHMPRPRRRTYVCPG